jgi:cytochrome b561
MERAFVQWRNDADRYGALSKLLHWLVVALVITQVSLAKFAENLPNGVEKLSVLARHKSFGMLILMLAVIRLVWRLANRVPELPAQMPDWQRKAAHLSHGLLYLLLFLQPITGWIMSSAKNYPVSFFGWFQFPDLVAPNPALTELFEEIHEGLGKTLVVVALLHAAAALYHHLVMKDTVLRRMLPGRARP